MSTLNWEPRGPSSQATKPGSSTDESKAVNLSPYNTIKGMCMPVQNLKQQNLVPVSLSMRAVLQPSSVSHCLWRAVPHPISVFLCPGSTVANQCFPRSTLANQCFPLSVMAIPQPISVFLCLQWQYHSQSVVFSFCPLHHFISNHLMISDGYTWAETEHLRRCWSFSLGFSEALIKWNGSVPCALTVFFFLLQCIWEAHCEYVFECFGGSHLWQGWI